MTELFAVLLLIPGLALLSAGVSEGELRWFLIGAVLVAVAWNLILRED